MTTDLLDLDHLPDDPCFWGRLAACLGVERNRLWDKVQQLEAEPRWTMAEFLAAVEQAKTYDSDPIEPFDVVADIQAAMLRLKSAADLGPKQVWTEAQIRAAYCSRASDSECVTDEDTLIEALKAQVWTPEEIREVFKDCTVVMGTHPCFGDAFKEKP